MQNNKKMIYADDILSTLKEDKSINGANLRRVIQHIDDATAVGAVVHGRWEKTEYKGFVRCSVCKDVYINEEWLEDGKWKGCPNCGAKMDGGNEDEKQV